MGPARQRAWAIQPDAVDTVFLQDKLEFLEEQGFDLASGPSQPLLPRPGGTVDSRDHLDKPNWFVGESNLKVRAGRIF